MERKKKKPEPLFSQIKAAFSTGLVIRPQPKPWPSCPYPITSRAYLFDCMARWLFERGRASAEDYKSLAFATVHGLPLADTVPRTLAKVSGLLIESGIASPFSCETGYQTPVITRKEYFSRRDALLAEVNHGEMEEEKDLRRRLAEAEAVRRETKRAVAVGLQPGLTCGKADALQVIEFMETNLAQVYEQFQIECTSSGTGAQMLAEFQSNCSSSKLPLAAEIRLEQLVEEYTPKFQRPHPLYHVDQMDGVAFEKWCAHLLEQLGYADIELTPSSGDQGVDIVAVKDSVRYAFQCKCYTADLGNTPIQEVHAGAAFYHCHVGVVVTNRHFTAGACALAAATGVLLWDRDKLRELLGAVGVA